MSTVKGNRGRERADVHLVNQGDAESRSKAQALILAGCVYQGERRIDKAGTLVTTDALLSVRQTERFVSRGGYKLEGALEDLSVDPTGRVCADVGASTGGFTDCLLQAGARRVYAIDVGRGLLAQRLCQDPRVTVMDKTNARHLQANHFEESLDLVVVDASFIGIAKLLPGLCNALLPGKLLLAMIKPQFEVGKELAAKSRGVIRDPAVREEAISRVMESMGSAGFDCVARCDSRLRGPKGNVEHFVLARRLDPDAQKTSTQMS